MHRNNKIVIAALFFSFFTCFFYLRVSAFAETGTDERLATLLEGAKKERTVLWYTTLSIAECDTITRKFKEKYPFITIEIYRSGSDNILVKMLAEVQAKRYVFDVAMNTAPEREILDKKGVGFAKYLSPHRSFYPEGFKDTEGYWTDLYMNLNVIGYNTKLVSSRELPKTYEDLLKPRWKGKMGMDTKAYTWFAALLKLMGEKNGLEYMRKLGEQNIQFRTGRTLNAQMVAAGEIDLSITCYNQRIEEMMAKGAPVNWVAIQPVIPEIHPISVSARAPHPNAARLLVDYLQSKEGQEVLAGLYKISSRTDVEPLVPALKRGLNIMNPDFPVADNYDNYTKLYRKLLMRK